MWNPTGRWTRACVLSFCATLLLTSCPGTARAGSPSPSPSPAAPASPVASPSAAAASPAPAAAAASPSPVALPPDFQLAMDAIEKAEPAPLIARLTPALRNELEEPLVRFILAQIRQDYGSPQKLPTVTVTQREHEGVMLDVAQAVVPFERGEAKLQVVTHGEQIVGLTVDCPITYELRGRLHDTLSRRLPGHEALAAHYTTRARALLEKIHSGDDAGALALFHPEAQKQLGLPKMSADFARVREHFGELEGARYLSADIVTKGQENEQEFTLDLAMDGSLADGTVRIGFKLIGLKAHLVSYYVYEIE